MRKALFLDRDGVINKEKNYLYKIDDFEFIDGVFETCQTIQQKGYLIIVVTNQSGIARGLYTEEDYIILRDWMIKRFIENGIKIDAVYHCPHHPEYSGICDCRKPKPGMLMKAKQDYNLSMENSILVGDKESDIEAGNNARVGNNILVRTGHYFDIAKTRADKIIDGIIELPYCLI